MLNLIFFNVNVAWNKKKHFRAIKKEAQEKNLNFHGSIFWPGLASLIDVVTTCLQMMALLLMPASIANIMVGGGIIITVVLVSKWM